MATRASGGRTDTNFQAVAKSRKISVSMRRTAPLLYRHGLKRRVTGGRAGSGIVEMRSRPIEVANGEGKSEPDEGWGGLLRLPFLELGAEESRDQRGRCFGIL